MKITIKELRELISEVLTKDERQRLAMLRRMDDMNPLKTIEFQHKAVTLKDQDLPRNATSDYDVYKKADRLLNQPGSDDPMSPLVRGRLPALKRLRNHKGTGLRKLLQRSAEADELEEVIKKQGDKYVLWTKHKKNGKRRKLGTHASKESAEAQERAIHAHGG